MHLAMRLTNQIGGTIVQSLWTSQKQHNVDQTMFCNGIQLSDPLNEICLSATVPKKCPKTPNLSHCIHILVIIKQFTTTTLTELYCWLNCAPWGMAKDAQIQSPYTSFTLPSGMINWSQVSQSEKTVWNIGVIFTVCLGLNFCRCLPSLILDTHIQCQ